jgi:D-glycero-D-manno-heptose 1,7-bisphosphate phosphatase
MLEKAIARFNVDVSKSYFIGDSPRDMEAAKKVGVTPIKITTNQPLIEILSQINL